MGRRLRDDIVDREASRQLADELRRRRRDRSWTQQKLADEAGLSYQTVRSIESNSTVNPGIFTLKSLTDALEVSLEDVVAQLTPEDERA